MWSVGISVSTSTEAARLGYDDRQINRIVIRMAQYFLDRDMRVIFGHDWREDGVMRAVADFAGVVRARVGAVEEPERTQRLVAPGKLAEERMINAVPTGRASLSSAAVAAELDSGGVLRVIPVSEAREHVSERVRSAVRIPNVDTVDARVAQLTELRHWLTSSSQCGFFEGRRSFWEPGSKAQFLASNSQSGGSSGRDSCRCRFPKRQSQCGG